LYFGKLRPVNQRAATGVGGQMSKRGRELKPVKILIDTCVWLDLAKEYKDRPVLYVLEHATKYGGRLIVPRIVLDEFGRNKQRLVEENARSLSAALHRARDMAKRFGNKRRIRTVYDELSDLDHKLVNLRDEVAESVERVETLLTGGEVVEISDAVKIRAANRAIQKKAPFHKQRNGMADAILMEVYRDYFDTLSTGEHLAFVTHNIKDFSQQGADSRLPHPDFADVFTRIRSRYYITLVDALKAYWPGDTEDLLVESNRLDFHVPRRMTEISDAEFDLNAMRWYDRHKTRADQVRRRKIKIVDTGRGASSPFSSTEIDRYWWTRELAYAKRLEDMHGKENLGPHSDFEWGVLTGKVSALRWVMGEEWDETGIY
jgi:predicted nucleic acid-binding protein